MLEKIIACRKRTFSFTTTLANALIIGIATKDMVANSAAFLHSMVKNTLEKGPLSKPSETEYLLTDKDIHRCQACGETYTLSPKLWKKLRDRPDDFECPKLLQRVL